MSVHVTSWVLKHSEVSVPGRRLVLLVLADHASDDGTNSYPAVETIAHECRMSERGVQYALKALRESGQIEKLGVHPVYGTNEWRVVMGVHSVHPPGVQPDVVGGVKPIAPEPSNSNHQGSESAREVRAMFDECFSYWQQRTGHTRAKPSPDLRAKFKARLQEGFTVEDVRKGIDGIAANGYVNDVGVKHDDFELVVRNGTKLRMNMQRADAKQPATNGVSKKAAEGDYRTRHYLKMAGLDQTVYDSGVPDSEAQG